MVLLLYGALQHFSDIRPYQAPLGYVNAVYASIGARWVDNNGHNNGEKSANIAV
jgi:hypothetical protein